MDGEEEVRGGAETASLDRLVKVLWAGVAVGALALVLTNSWPVFAAVGVGVLIFLASFAGGSFFGFLFGIPRVLSREQTGPAPAEPASPTGASTLNGRAPAAGGAGSGSNGSRLLNSNTNLERISDWLTTLLVGATLVQIHELNSGLVGFRDFLAVHAAVFPGPGGTRHAGPLPAVGPIVLTFGSAAGFLFMYLNTRLVLSRLFHQVEQYLAGGQNLRGPTVQAVRAIASESAGDFVQWQLSQKRSLSVQEALNLMFDGLYRPSGYETVIQLGAELSSTPAVQRAEYWFYLAAAFGQKHHDLIAREAPPEERLSVRDNALDCARRAVRLDASYKARLRALATPEGVDNDLADFQNDPQFRALVDR